MKRIIFRMVLILVLCLPAIPTLAAPPVNDPAASKQNSVDEAHLQNLQNRMLNDPQILSLISTLQNDPDMMALISDPSFIQAVQNRDTSKISGDPRFAKLLNKPAIQEILKRLGR